MVRWRPTRRAILAGSAALTASVIFPARAASGVISGAIRWDAWYGSSVTSSVQNSLGPSAWQSRAPWFSSVLNQYQTSINGNSQANIDLEITAANAAGLKFWAYDWYNVSSGAPDGSGFMNAWSLHQSSSVRALMNWCLLLQNGHVGDAAAFTAMIAQIVIYMGQSNYQTVISGRPLLFWFNDNGNLDASYAAAITSFRAACVTAGLGSPYIVILQGQDTGASPAATATACGADAISSYATFNWGTFASLTTRVQAQWTNYAATGVPIVPNVMIGSDTRPRLQNPTPWQSKKAPFVGMINYTVAGTVNERVAQVQAAINYVQANPTVVPSAAILIYSWDECDEGGGALIPTLGDSPAVSPPYLNNILTGLSAILP